MSKANKVSEYIYIYGNCQKFHQFRYNIVRKSEVSSKAKCQMRCQNVKMSLAERKDSRAPGCAIWCPLLPAVKYSCMNGATSSVRIWKSPQPSRFPSNRKVLSSCLKILVDFGPQMLRLPGWIEVIYVRTCRIFIRMSLDLFPNIPWNFVELLAMVWFAHRILNQSEMLMPPKKRWRKVIGNLPKGASVKGAMKKIGIDISFKGWKEDSLLINTRIYGI